MLKDTVKTHGANFAQFQGVSDSADYGDPASEYAAALTACALMDRSVLGRIELSGADRLNFLQRMSTNECEKLAVGSGAQTVLTTPEAKIVELLTVYVRPESLLCLSAPQNRSKVFNWFRRNIFFRDKVKTADLSDSTMQFAVF